MKIKVHPAVDLDDVVYLFDPISPLGAETADDPEGELRDFYVERDAQIGEDIKRLLGADIRRNKPVKLLFTGHRGSGKSTELNYLYPALAEKFFVVKVQMRRETDVHYVDVLVKAAMNLLREGQARDVLAKSFPQKLTEALEQLSLFVERSIFGAVTMSDQTAVPTEFTAKLKFFEAEFESKFDLNPTLRQQIRRTSEQHINEVVSHINLLADAIRRYDKPVLFIFEDTDRLDNKVAHELFFGHGNSLTAFRASAIFVTDISLRYADLFTTLKSHFQDCLTLPSIKLQRRNGEPYETGRNLLRQIVSRRIQYGLLDYDALESLVKASGGHLRSLTTLTRNAALIAAARQSAKIELADAQRAASRLRGDFIAILESKEYPLLKARAHDKWLNSDRETETLLEKLALLEYANDDRWCDVHPTLRDEVEARTFEPPAQS